MSHLIHLVLIRLYWGVASVLRDIGALFGAGIRIKSSSCQFIGQYGSGVTLEPLMVLSLLIL